MYWQEAVPCLDDLEKGNIQSVISSRIFDKFDGLIVLSTVK